MSVPTDDEDDDTPKDSSRQEHDVAVYVHKEMQAIMAKIIGDSLIDCGPKLWTDPFSTDALDATIAGIVDGVKRLEKASGKRLLALLATLAMEESMQPVRTARPKRGRKPKQ